MYTWILVFFTVFLKNRNISSKIKRSKVTDYAALKIKHYKRFLLYIEDSKKIAMNTDCGRKHNSE